MKATKDKPIPMVTFTKNEGKDSYTSKRTIKIKAITGAERQQLRITSYQYLLP